VARQASVARRRVIGAITTRFGTSIAPSFNVENKESGMKVSFYVLAFWPYPGSFIVAANGVKKALTDSFCG
jgi:hypothetical protein